MASLGARIRRFRERRAADAHLDAEPHDRDGGPGLADAGNPALATPAPDQALPKEVIFYGRSHWFYPQVGIKELLNIETYLDNALRQRLFRLLEDRLAEDDE